MTTGFNSPALSDGSGVVASFPGRMDWDTNKVKPNNNSGWIVQVNDKVNARRHDDVRHLRERQLDSSRNASEGRREAPFGVSAHKRKRPRSSGAAESVSA